MQWLQITLALIIIAVAVYAVLRRVDVRLVLFLSALALGIAALNPWPIIVVFFETFADERFFVPIGCAMGFAYTLRHTGCDQHLVHLLVRPLTKVRWLLVPGTIVVGFIVNIPIISQTSTAASLGPVVIPILTAARLRAVTIGAVLLLGCSIGGELLNPGAPELRTIVEESRKLLQKKGMSITHISEHAVRRRIFPLDVLALLTATGLFWYLASREEKRSRDEDDHIESAQSEQEIAAFKVNYFKAAVPFIPLALLFITGPPFNLVKVPAPWLVNVPPIQSSAGQQLRFALAANPQAGFPAAAPWATLGATPEMPARLSGLYNSRLIGLAMLIGVAVAAAVSGRKALEVPKKFFEGAGYAFANIVSLIVTARCFGVGIKNIGLAAMLGSAINYVPWLLIPLCGALATFFAVLSGSGMATTQSLFDVLAAPAVAQDVDPTLVGAVVALSSAAGRTMSPVAAVCLMSATLTNTNPFDLSKRVALPLLAGVLAVVIAAFFLAVTGN